MTMDTPYYRTWAAGPTCQYPNCPAPTSSTPTVHVAVPPKPTPPDSLAITGGDAILLGLIGGLAIVVGALMQRCRRWRVRS